MRSIKDAIFVYCFFFGAAFAQIHLSPFLDLLGETSDPSISPDGKTLVFDWWTLDESQWGIYTRPMSGGAPRLFARGGDGVAISPQWSPDGLWIAFLRWQTPRTGSLFIKPAIGGRERPLGSVCNNRVAWTADSRSLIIPTNGDTDLLEKCGLKVISIEPEKPSWPLADRGTFPAVSPDGKTLAFIRDRELHLLGLTADGHAAGSEMTLTREPLRIIDPAWAPSSMEIFYLLAEDRSVLRRIEVRAGAKPRDAGSIAGEFLRVSMAQDESHILAEVYSHEDSYWRIELHAPNPHFEKLRRLTWNVRNLRVAPDGRRLLYTVSDRGQSVFYTSNIDGSAPRRLFSIACERVEQVAWSPEGKRMAITCEPWVGQVAPSHLYVSALNGPPHRLLEQSDQVYSVSWAQDGSALYFARNTKDEVLIWRLNLTDNKLTQITHQSAWEAFEAGDKFLYFRGSRNPFDLVRVPITGGSEETMLSDVLQIAVGRDQIYFTRRDASRQGLTLFRLDLATRRAQTVATIGFGLGPFQVSPDGGYIYAEKHDPPTRHIMQLQDFH